MLSHKCSVNAQGGTSDETALHKCISHGTVECLKLLVTHTPAPNPNLGDALGETALHRAAACADIFLWKQLLTLGGDVNLPNDGGYTPIQKALRAGNTVALGVMRECGAYTVSY